MIVLGEVVAASGDREILVGNASEKIQRMNTVFLLSRNVDSSTLKTTNPMTYGTIDKLKDFAKLEHDGVIDDLQ